MKETLNELGRLVASIRRHPTKEKLRRLEDVIKLIEYHLTPVAVVAARATTVPRECKTCGEGWRTGELINFGDAGWFCRKHYPSQPLPPVGWVPPRAESDAIETRRKEVLQKLTRDELRLINARVQ